MIFIYFITTPRREATKKNSEKKFNKVTTNILFMEKLLEKSFDLTKLIFLKWDWIREPNYV